MAIKVTSQKISAPLTQKVHEISGQDPNMCFQCGLCAGSCPMTGEMELYNTSNCTSSGSIGNWEQNDCFNGFSSPAHSVGFVGLATGACPSSIMGTTGAVEGTDPFTVCCTPQ